MARKMQFSEAKVADILRGAQRDEVFVREMQDNIQSVLKLFGVKNYQGHRRIIPGLANGWYYFLTTLGNLQTLGEEYTGTLRVNSDNKIPSKCVELIWLTLYIGGEALLERLIRCLQNNIDRSETLTEQSKSLFLKILRFMLDYKSTVKRIHHSLFYIDGRYYNISNRITGIKYVLVRQWLQDDSFTQSFKILGHVTLFYILFNFVQQMWSSKSSGNIPENQIAASSGADVSWKGCVLCAETLTNPCATPCGHIFCWNCINDSLSYQQNCPVCREMVTPNRIIFLQNYM